MSFLFWTVLVLSSIYFLLLPRRHDLFTMAHFGATVYFLPGIVPSYALEERTYLVFSIVLLIVVTGAIIHDRSLRIDLEVLWPGITVGQNMSNILLFFSIIIFFVQIYLFGIEEFFKPKLEQNRDIVLHYLHATAISIGLILSFVLRQYVRFLVFLLQHGLLFVAGTRTHLAMSLLAIGSIWLFSRGCIVLTLEGRKWLWWGITSIGIIGIVGKDLYGAVVVAVTLGLPFGDVFFEGLRTRQSILEFIERTEPYHTQLILNETFKQGFRLDGDYLLDAPMYLIPFSQTLGTDLHRYSNAIKVHFFPEWGEGLGVAANFWAEAIATGGWSLLFLYGVMFVGGLAVFNSLLKSRSAVVMVIAALMGAYWAVYIHRNSLFQIIGHEKRVLYFALIGLFLAVVWRSWRGIVRGAVRQSREHSTHVD